MRLSLTLQQGGYAAHREDANEEKAENVFTTRDVLISPGAGNAGMVVESGSVDISRLSGVKADESHLA